ncbi:ATP-binding protein [Streptomyces alkaliterrae]|uniref:ATP-binding protein n=2 Tax=Streptomyces alkaliterrae TaxID=2213162 RepID=A0A5P0YW63_9ACTN|nr:ATP-binding protein [Streptomyces alkaliterrae]MBB1260768.1 ATP-binding protein [Streptomyces alkaliterrae]MQS04521.1 ATP-binding protein [Streptomyces alkaliterrae]
MSTTRRSPAGDRGPEAGTAPGPGASPVGQLRDMRQVRRLRLVGAGGAVQRSRDFTRQALEDWGWLPAADVDRRAAAEDVLLVVSELVTNACLHAGGPRELAIVSGPRSLRVEVADDSPDPPSPRDPHRPGRPGGHGMFIVGRLCLDWGVLRTPDTPGKTVWAELPTPV